MLLLDEVEAFTATPVPASRPANAALAIRVLVVFVMGKCFLQSDLYRTSPFRHTPTWGLLKGLRPGLRENR